MNKPHIVYNDLRRALVTPDDMTLAELRALKGRVEEAAEAYPDMPDTPARNAENEAIRAYARYIDAVAQERHGIAN